MAVNEMVPCNSCCVVLCLHYFEYPLHCKQVRQYSEKEPLHALVFEDDKCFKESGKWKKLDQSRC